MDIFPAIDLRHGRVVRLSQGDADRLTVYEEDAVAQAVRFADAGARWIHVVDLDRAFGDGDNDAVVRAVVAELGGRVRVQSGGGYRSLDRIERAMDLGVSRVVIGTAAVSDPELVPKAVESVGAEWLAVGLDARDGMVAVRGWTESSGQSVDAVAARVIAAGVTTIIYTDIARDGMLAGPDLDGAVRLQALGAAAIASGGVASAAHIRAAAEAGVAGVIVGRALYAGQLTVADALASAVA